MGNHLFVIFAVLDVSCAVNSCINHSFLHLYEIEIGCLTIAVQSRYLKCSLAVAKRGFYRAANSIFGKIGSSASAEVIMQLISSKCIPILLYGLQVLPKNIS